MLRGHHIQIHPSSSTGSGAKGDLNADQAQPISSRTVTGDSGVSFSLPCYAPPVLLESSFARTHAATFLERLVSSIVSTINERDFAFKSADSAEFRSRIAPNWEARFDCYPHSMTFTQQTDIWRQATESFPNVKFRITNISAMVHRHGRKASVYVHLEMKGHDHVQLQGVCQWKWELVEDRWSTHEFTALRGPLDPENMGGSSLL